MYVDTIVPKLIANTMQPKLTASPTTELPANTYTEPTPVNAAATSTPQAGQTQSWETRARDNKSSQRGQQQPSKQATTITTINTDSLLNCTDTIPFCALTDFGQ